MASIDDAIFLMDDEVIQKPIKSSKHTTNRDIYISLHNDNITIAKSPPIDIIKPEKKKIKQKEEFVPSSPYTV